MNASEARQRAENKNTSDFRKQFDTVIQQIAHYSQGGYFAVTIYELRPDVESELLNLGYMVERKQDGRNGEDIKISW